MNRILLMVLRNFWKVPTAYFKLCRYAKHPERYSEEEKYQHIRYIMNLAVTSGNIDLKVSGTEQIPRTGGFLFYGNHQGMFDILAIAATCDLPFAAVFKKELCSIPFLKQVICCTDSLAMDREDIRQSLKVIQDVTRKVTEGRRYLIFPEGTRSKRGNEMLPFHGGSFRCAVKAKCPIVPIALINSFQVLDQKGCKPVTVQIHYLKPILYEEYQGMKSLEVANLVQERIAAAIQEFS